MTDIPLVIRHETAADADTIDRLHERAFGPGRFAKTAYRLREGIDPIAALSFTALVGTLIVGSIRLTPIRIGATPALLLGPLTVEPGHRLVILVGDEPYYGRAGFKKVPRGRIELPGPVDPDRLLVLELVDGAFDGVTGMVLGTKDVETA